jgi:DNA-3-methyladenine glycosylase I
MKKKLNRCSWVLGESERYVRYHDEEWGVPLHDDRLLFEYLILEGAMAGLSWLTVLKKRERYREVYKGFDPEVVSRFTEAYNAKLLKDPGVIRNRLKVASAVMNAKVVVGIQKEFGSFDAYLWGALQDPSVARSATSPLGRGELLYRPIVTEWRSWKEIPAKTEVSDRISKDLKRRGCSFVGSTIIYAFMQAVGMVNDHEVECFRWGEVL